jgi:hypothetical protein
MPLVLVKAQMAQAQAQALALAQVLVQVTGRGRQLQAPGRVLSPRAQGTSALVTMAPSWMVSCTSLAA